MPGCEGPSPRQTLFQAGQRRTCGVSATAWGGREEGLACLDMCQAALPGGPTTHLRGQRHGVGGFLEGALVVARDEQTHRALVPVWGGRRQAS